MTPALVHPRRRRLLEWLETGAPPDVERHLAGCLRCVTRLEALAPAGPDLRPALAELLREPDDLVARLRTGIEGRMENRADLGLLARMFGVPFAATRLLLDHDRER